MTRPGFHLGRLVVTGKDRQPAMLEFAPGLNVVSGVSNSGKTYVLQCIDWLMGASKPPKGVAQGGGYDRAYLELRTFDSRTLTITRALKSGGAEAWTGPWDARPDEPLILGSRHTAGSEKTISHFLLSLFGAAGARIRKNARNELIDLSFRTIAQLFIVHELEMLSEGSPLSLEEIRADTSAVSGFSYVLTGLDDSALIAEPDPTVEKAVRSGRRDLLLDLVREMEAEVARHEEAAEAPDDLERRLTELSASVAKSSEAVSKAWRDRETAWSALKWKESQLLALRELGKRFKLLSAHYDSDLQRLEFMEEGKALVEQLETVRCPFCGSELSEHVASALCLGSGAETIPLAEACSAEARKIRTQQRDLKAAEADLEVEIAALEGGLRRDANDLQAIEGEIRSSLEPTMAASRTELETLLAQRQRREAYDLNSQRLNALRRLLAEAEARPKGKAPEPFAAVQSEQDIEFRAIRQMCDSIEDVLRAWRVPCKTVEFNERTRDLVVDGVPRRNNGKGVRGLWHSAFNIGLMLAARNGPGRHPGFVVLDSPLTTLHEQTRSEDPEEVDGEVHHAFFEHLAGLDQDVQVVVLENKQPPPGVISRIKLERFVGKQEIGRAGFFPPLPDTHENK